MKQETATTALLNAPDGATARQTDKSSQALGVDPELDALVREIIERIADKWTMLVLETLAEHGRLRFTQLGGRIGGVSQKMLTKTVRQMEADGLITRTVHPVIPPHVDYELTSLGLSLGEAFCGVWIWAGQHRNTIRLSREAFQERNRTQPTA